MRELFMPFAIASALLWIGCGSGSDTPAGSSATSSGSSGSSSGVPATTTGSGVATGVPTGSAATPAAGSAAAADSTPSAVAADPNAGGVVHLSREGPAAVVNATTGVVEVKRMGETTFAAVKVNDKLYPGDELRTGDKSTAKVVLADQSVVEVSEVSAIGIASRDGTADPASAAAVLAGVARFTVTPRAPAEGPFRVYTPSGFVVTKGTTYGVGVDASGAARVGVESGQVDVVGLAQPAGPPVQVGSGSATTLDASGSASAPTAFGSDDWGQWRDNADAKVDAGSAVDAHGSAMAALDQQLGSDYQALDTTVDAAVGFEDDAAADAGSNNTAAYQAAAPAGVVAIDGSFAIGARIEASTWAYAGHAELASELYVRHPELAPRWRVIAPRVDAAVLWPRRYEIVAAGYFEPLRMQYYVHDPIGRVHAPLVGVTVPTFYAGVPVAPVDPVQLRASVGVPVLIAPEVAFHVQARPIWPLAPAPTWFVGIHVAPAPWRVGGGWYVRPAVLHANLIVGAEVRGRVESRLVVGPPIERERLVAQWRRPIGVRVRVVEPDLANAERARAGIVLDGAGRIDAHVRGRGGVEAGPGAGVREQPPPVGRPGKGDGHTGPDRGGKVGVRPDPGTGRGREAGHGLEVHGTVHENTKPRGR